MNDSTTPEMPRTRLLGVTLDCVTERQAVEWICARAQAGRGGFVVTANLDHLRRCRLDPSYEALVGEADLVVADGMPLIWASRLAGSPLLPERVAGSTMTLALCAAASERQVSVYLLGGDPGVAERAAGILARRHPGLRIAGVYCPPMGFEKDPRCMAELNDALQAAEPDIVLVALGSPKQERLIADLRGRYPGTCWMGVGISLSFITGDVRRAPLWMQRAGLEWLHRLIQEPRRLFARYVLHGIPWGLILLGSALVDRLSNGQTATVPHRQ